MSDKVYRLRELDFLRGIAIILVIFRHQFLFTCTQKMGWIGVDLFFVLSGFLVSGLLFKEYMKFGNIQPGLFLIRRGFKIYPLYYLTYILYLAPILIKHQFKWEGFLSDMFFIQNYTWNWGYAYSASWSLAVEEHFYIGFAVLMLVGIRKGFFKFTSQVQKKTSKFEVCLLVMMACCFALRLYTNIEFPENGVKNITMTHLRIDALLAGVYVSYWYYFKNELLSTFVNLYKKWLLVLALVLISFTPFADYDESFFVRTVGFLFLYIAFAIILCWFLIDKSINGKLDKYLSSPIVNIVSQIGLASYSIYIIHSFVIYLIGIAAGILLKKPLPIPVMFVLVAFFSIFIGMLMTKYIEKFFLHQRNKYFPSRIA